jgi:hypothetical protein
MLGETREKFENYERRRERNLDQNKAVGVKTGKTMTLPVK